MRLSAILILSSLLLLNGCASIYRLSDDNEEHAVYRGIYPSTKMDFAMLNSAANDNGGNWMSGVVTFLSPFVIIDIPISVIADTITLPYDAYQHSYNSKYIDFWQKIEKTKDTSMPMSEYLYYFSHVGAIVVNKQARLEVNEKLLKLYFDVAMTDNKELSISQTIINTVVKKSLDYDDLSFLRNYVCDVGSANISNKKFSNAFKLMLSSVKYSKACVNRLAKAGLECRLLVASIDLPEEYIRQCYQEEPIKFISQLSRAKLTPSDIQKEIFKFELERVTNKFGILENIQRALLTNLLNIAKNTKDISLIDEIYALGNKYLNKSLTYNPAVPFKYKENDIDFLIRMVRGEGVSRDILLKMIYSHPDNDQFMNVIASGKYVDVDIYNALLISVSDSNKSTVLNRIVSNRHLLSNDIYHLMLSVEGIQDLLSLRSYQKILKVAEPIVSEIYDFGIVEFVKSGEDDDTLEVLKQLSNYQAPGQWIVSEHTNKIPKTLGVKFGILYKLSQKRSDTSYLISIDVIYPQGGLNDPDKKGLQNGMPTTKDTVSSGVGYVEYVHLDKPWMLKSGEWVIQIRYKDKLVIEKSFFVEDK